MRRYFSLRNILVFGTLTLVTIWLFPGLATILLILTLALWTAIVLGVLHEYNVTAPLRPRWKRSMDLLDQFTNKTVLEGLTNPRAKVIDAPALAATVKAKVIGQDAVADEIATTIRRRLAMEEREKPVGVFLLAGPAGVGKTEEAKQFAAALDWPFLPFDMSTCTTPEGASTLFGSPKGYAGSDSYGQLTAGIKDHGQCVVLLDEFEKAHPDVMRMFLTAWNDGWMTERSDGKKVPTNRVVFFLTTNAAADRIGELTKKTKDRDQLNGAAKAALQESGFPPETLSRVDRVFSFSYLEGLDVARVAIVHLLNSVKGYGLAVADQGIDPQLLHNAMQRSEKLQAAGGVREIIRALEEQVADGLIEAKSSGAEKVKLVVRVDEDAVNRDDNEIPDLIIDVERAA